MDLMFDPPSGSKASRLEVWENMLVSYFSFSRMAASICVRMFIPLSLLDFFPGGDKANGGLFCFFELRVQLKRFSFGLKKGLKSTNHQSHRQLKARITGLGCGSIRPS